MFVLLYVWIVVVNSLFVLIFCPYLVHHMHHIFWIRKFLVLGAPIHIWIFCMIHSRRGSLCFGIFWKALGTLLILLFNSWYLCLVIFHSCSLFWWIIYIISIYNELVFILSLNRWYGLSFVDQLLQWQDNWLVNGVLRFILLEIQTI